MCASQSGGPRKTQSIFHQSSHARRRGHEAGATCRAVAASFDIAPSTAGKWNRAFARSGSVGPARIGGYLRSALEPHGAWIREQVRARPGITVRELARRVSERLGLSVGRDAVWRFLRRCGLSFKKMTRVADERERPDVKRRRERWMRHQGRIGPERLVFLDETCVKTNMAPPGAEAPRASGCPDRPRSATGIRRPSSPRCVTTGSMRPGCSTVRSTARSL